MSQVHTIFRTERDNPFWNSYYVCICLFTLPCNCTVRVSEKQRVFPEVCGHVIGAAEMWRPSWWPQLSVSECHPPDSWLQVTTPLLLTATDRDDTVTALSARRRFPLRDTVKCFKATVYRQPKNARWYKRVQILCFGRSVGERAGFKMIVFMHSSTSQFFLVNSFKYGTFLKLQLQQHWKSS